MKLNRIVNRATKLAATKEEEKKKKDKIVEVGDEEKQDDEEKKKDEGKEKQPAPGLKAIIEKVEELAGEKKKEDEQMGVTEGEIHLDTEPAAEEATEEGYKVPMQFHMAEKYKYKIKICEQKREVYYNEEKKSRILL